MIKSTKSFIAIVTSHKGIIIVIINIFFRKWFETFFFHTLNDDIALYNIRKYRYNAIRLNKFLNEIKYKINKNK